MNIEAHEYSPFFTSLINNVGLDLVHKVIDVPHRAKCDHGRDADDYITDDGIFRTRLACRIEC